MRAINVTASFIDVDHCGLDLNHDKHGNMISIHYGISYENGEDPVLQITFEGNACNNDLRHMVSFENLCL